MELNKTRTSTAAWAFAHENQNILSIAQETE